MFACGETQETKHETATVGMSNSCNALLRAAQTAPAFKETCFRKQCARSRSGQNPDSVYVMRRLPVLCTAIPCFHGIVIRGYINSQGRPKEKNFIWNISVGVTFIMKENSLNFPEIILEVLKNTLTLWRRNFLLNFSTSCI